MINVRRTMQKMKNLYFYTIFRLLEGIEMDWVLRDREKYLAYEIEKEDEARKAEELEWARCMNRMENLIHF